MGIDSVLIVGGGPAGMVAAIALSRAGVSVELVELQPRFAAVGIGVNLQNSPLRALDTLGLVDEIERRGFPTDVVNMLTSAGEPMMPPLRPASLIEGRRGSIAIGRGELAEILADAVAAENIDVRFSLTVDELTSVADGVDVVFSDGSTGHYDLVVGADGVNSRVRELILGDDDPGLAYSGQSIWRARAPRGEVDEYQIIHGPGGKVGLVPISQEGMYVYVLQSFETEPVRGELGDDDDDASMLAAMAPYGGIVPEVAASLEPGADFRPLKYHLVPSPWYRGRVLLIGDAAHSTTPHISYGLGIAIEDGIVLAELVQTAQTVDATLASFMERRFERARLVVENSLQISRWEQHPPDDRSAAGAMMGRTMGLLEQPI